MNTRKQECRICAAPRKERTSHYATNGKNGAKQWPTKQGNQTKNTTNELWNLIEAESNKIKATTVNPNTQLGGNKDTTTDMATSTPLEGNDNDTESTKPMNVDTVHTALKLRNQILGEIKKLETMTVQEGSASGRLKAAILADVKKDLEAIQQIHIRNHQRHHAQQSYQQRFVVTAQSPRHFHSKAPFATRQSPNDASLFHQAHCFSLSYRPDSAKPSAGVGLIAAQGIRCTNPVGSRDVQIFTIWTWDHRQR